MIVGVLFSSFSFLFRFKLEPYESWLGPPDLSLLDEVTVAPPNVASPVPEVAVLAETPGLPFEVAVPAVATAPPPLVAPIPVRPLLDLARGQIDEEGAAEIGAWLPSAGLVGLGLFAGCLLCGLAVVAVALWRRYQRQR